MLSLALAKRVSWRESGQRAATRLAATATTRSIVATRQRAACAASTNAAQPASKRRSASTSLLRSAAESSRTRRDAPPRWATTTASFSSGYGDYGGGYSSSGSSGWRNRRPLCSVGTTKPTAGQAGDGEGGEDQPAAEAAAGSGLEMKEGVSSSSSSSSSSKAGKSGEVSGEQQQEGSQKQKQPKKRRPPAAKGSRGPHSFGKPLSMLVSASGDDGGDSMAWAGGGGGSSSSSSSSVDVEDELPDPQLIEVVREEDEQAAADANDPRTRVSAARPEVVHALSRGLAEERSREVADNLCSYASSERSTADTLAQLEKLLLRRPYQAEWVMPLVRAHLNDEKKPSAQTHQEHLSYVRDMNTKEVSLEDMAESLLRAHARYRWGPDMTREKLRTDHPERWEEAVTLSEKLADRLPVCRHQLVWKTLQRYLGAEKTSRRLRFLHELSNVLRTSTHLVLPALARFWRVDSIGKNLQKDVDHTKQQHLKDQAVLARWLLFARRKSLHTVSEFNGPWSIEELHELEEARFREEEREMEDKREEQRARYNDDDDDDEFDFDLDDFDDDWGDGGGEDGEEGAGWKRRRSSERQKKKLDTAAVKLISQALPPQIPKIMPAPPLGLYDLYVVERPRALRRPPPRDIFGGDTPMGIGEAGMSEAPEWRGRDEDATRGVKAGEEYAWPEEEEEVEETKEEDDERPWWESAGKKELSPKRAKDYQEVEDVLLTGRRIKRPQEVMCSDFDKDLAAILIKTRLQERSALVAELNPDKTRQIELQLQEEGSRTAFVNGLPYGLSPWTIKEAFSRCGPVHQVMIREPTFRGSEDGNPTPSPVSSSRDKSKTKTKPKRGFAPKFYSSGFASSSPHGLVVFKDQEGFDRATAESFRIFGVVIDGVPVTTKPALQCRTLYVENFEMRTGVQMADAINAVLEPQYTVGLKTHALDDETPQVVAITLRNYAALRAVDTLLTDAGFKTTFHYTVPKARGSKPDETSDLFPDPSKVKPAPGDKRPPEDILFDKMMAFSKELGIEDLEGDEGGSSRSRLKDSLEPQHR